jgi:Domain of unknown function (DUF1905)
LIAAMAAVPWVGVPFDVEQTFGKKRVPIKATIDGAPYRGSLVRMGGPCHLPIVLKEIREKIGKGPGYAVDIVLEEDTEPRVVQISADLEKAPKGAPEAKTFLQNSPTLTGGNTFAGSKRLSGRRRERSGSLRQSLCSPAIRRGDEASGSGLIAPVSHLPVRVLFANCNYSAPALNTKRPNFVLLRINH